jgi:hypothetical protein
MCWIKHPIINNTCILFNDDIQKGCYQNVRKRSIKQEK